MRLYYDEHGRYAGRSQGVGFTLGGCAGAAFGIFVGCVIVFGWPLVVFQSVNGRDGRLAWLAETLWVVFLITGFLLIGRHLSRHAAPPSDDTTPFPAGPRDWIPLDDGRRLV